LINPQSITLVQASFARLAPMAPRAAALFYDNLFSLDGTLRHLFRANMNEQGRRLMQMIGLAVGKLDDLESLVPVLQGLGRRHLDYGVRDAHYGTVGAALLMTLEQALGEEFSPKVRQAWTEVYGLLANTMIAASREPLPA